MIVSLLILPAIYLRLIRCGKKTNSLAQRHDEHPVGKYIASDQFFNMRHVCVVNFPYVCFRVLRFLWEEMFSPVL